MGKKRSRKREEGKEKKRAKNSEEIENGSTAKIDDVSGNSAAEFGLSLASEDSGISVQPLGNMLFASGINIRNSGLGNLHQLSDELLCDIIGLLDPQDLASLDLTSKALYVFAHQDALWRSLVLRDFNGSFVFKGTWRNTYISSLGHTIHRNALLKIKNFYSDYLFQSWLCASVELKEEWLCTDNICRRSNISVEEFITEFEQPNKPLLITNAINNWPALKRWSKEYLLKVAGDIPFAAGPVDMKLKHYFIYAEYVKEERPLYIFDPKFADKVPQLAADYEVPIYFREDLFSILGKERPDFRWLIIGPARSGSSFHIDPNSTSAWNAVVKGSKKWIMYPPEVVPPGVHPSPDGAEVATPVSITEWFMNFYEQTKRGKHKPVECICRAGEVVFVPNGWWHIVINLEESIAITQNYVSRSNLLNVLEFLSRPNCKELVSGTTDRVNLYTKFKTKYESIYPGRIEQLQQEKADRQAKKKMSFWESITSGSSFKFNFGS